MDGITNGILLEILQPWYTMATLRSYLPFLIDFHDIRDCGVNVVGSEPLRGGCSQQQVCVWLGYQLGDETMIPHQTLVRLDSLTDGRPLEVLAVLTHRKIAVDVDRQASGTPLLHRQRKKTEDFTRRRRTTLLALRHRAVIGVGQWRLPFNVIKVDGGADEWNGGHSRVVSKFRQLLWCLPASNKLIHPVTIRLLLSTLADVKFLRFNNEQIACTKWLAAAVSNGVNDAAATLADGLTAARRQTDSELDSRRSAVIVTDQHFKTLHVLQKYQQQPRVQFKLAQ